MLVRMAGDEQSCIFCSIVAGSTPAEIVLETDDSIFFRDISPKAPVHVVGIPKRHMASLREVGARDAEVLGQLLVGAADAARRSGIEDSGYRVISNAGADAGQEVEHMHVHVMGGEPLGPLRC